MNQPLNIQPGQVTYSEQPEQTTPPGDINPTTSTPGLDFPNQYPQIDITFDKPTTITVVYIPTNRPNEPTNVEGFVFAFRYPNGTESEAFYSQVPSESTTTTPSPSSNGIVPPSSGSPQVSLPTDFEVPAGTVLLLGITSTTDNSAPQNVSL